mgnify:FL=1
MQTIKTKYLGATNHRGSRIKATTSSGISKTMSYDHELNQVPNHFRVARELIKELGWSGEYAMGSDGNSGDGYVFVNTDDSMVKISI